MPEGERTAPPRGRTRLSFLRFREWGGREFNRAALVYLASFLAGLGYGRLEIRDQKTADAATQMVPDIENRPDSVPGNDDGGPETAGKSDSRAVAAFAISLFLHNLRAAAITIGLGVLAGLLSYLPAAGNGAVLGYWCAGWFFVTGKGAFGVMALLLPHGVFELTAFFMAVAAGARLGRVAGDRGFAGRVEAFFRSWPAFLLIGGLLALAAAIESKLAFRLSGRG